jgi:hypothetical protein
MGVSRVRLLALVSIFVLLSTVVAQNAAALEEGEQLTYWYLGDSFDLNKEDDWIPFFSLSDVPYSLPLRGFISKSRNYFLDFGAVNWLTDWVDYRYGWPVPDHDRAMDEENLTGQLEYLFEKMTSRLEKPMSYVDVARNYSALDYMKDFDAPYEAFIPIIVMYGLNESYDESDMSRWVIHPDNIEDSLNEAFPLVSWETELYWFNYDNGTEFADLMEEKHQDVRIMIDDDFLNRTDYILHDIISSDPRYNSHDMVLPTLVMLQDYTLWSVYYGMAIGGLGRINSTFPEVDSWNLNGRNLYSYFYGGNPEEPRTAITPTVIHEVGHCIGQTDIHSLFGWLAAASSMSAMCAYQQTTTFDMFDMDLINNVQGIQLWGRFLDEIEYFRGFTLTTDQQTELTSLEDILSAVPGLLVSRDLDQLKQLLFEADDALDLISDELGETRKSDDWSDEAPAIDVHIDWIVGPGIPDAEAIVETIESDLNASRIVLPIAYTTLPTPIYNVTIDVHTSSDSFNNSVHRFWGSNLVEANTSMFSEDAVPEDAWDNYPFNTVFQNQSGYAIEGSIVEEWLTENPPTPEMSDKIHYRFYMMNLENITLVSPDNQTSLMPVLIVGAGAVIIVALVVVWKKRS